MGRLNFRIRGTGGRVLLCLHGFLGDGSDWEKFAEVFLKQTRDWKVVMIDLPGHSEEDADWVCPSVEELAFALRELVRAEGWGTAAVAGYSLGGRLGLHAALSFPDVFPVFIGISTSAGIEDETERAQRAESDSTLADRLRSSDDFTKFLSEWWYQPVLKSPAREAGDLENFLVSRSQRDPLRMAACLENWSPGRLPSQWTVLPGYPGRALLLSGEVDAKYTTLAGRLQKGFRDAEVQIVAAAGHQLLAEKAVEVAASVASFLELHE